MALATDLERYMLDLVNAERATNGLHALKLEQNLNTSADEHSQWMSDFDTFSHTGVSGTSAGDRIKLTDFDTGTGWGWAENIGAWSTDTNGSYYDEVDRLHVGLMNSPGHRANILDPNQDYIGIGIAIGPLSYQSSTHGTISLQSVLVTQNFASTTGDVDLDIQVSGNTPLVGEDGDDYLQGLSNADSITGGLGDDTLTGGLGDDTLKGGGGNDTLEGGDGDDLLTGGKGDDTLSGGDGINKLVGQAGADLLHGGNARDVLNGGGARDILYGNGGNDRLKGGARLDELYGGDGPDMLFGNAGDDLLFGQAGNDILNGGGDNDILTGGADDDYLRGGGGSDTFVFAANDGHDRVADFEASVDTLQFSTAMMGTATSAAEFVSTYASLQDGVVRFDFADSSVTLLGVMDISGLESDINFA